MDISPNNSDQVSEIDRGLGLTWSLFPHRHPYTKFASLNSSWDRLEEEFELK